eukprot:snap_masked-scaffold_10-processed-gene-9.24-mRNA-1 protein AED:1.00 eAED:1.00 QI:0/-1/0/0/-1/1/1/0/84
MLIVNSVLRNNQLQPKYKATEFCVDMVTEFMTSLLKKYFKDGRISHMYSPRRLSGASRATDISNGKFIQINRMLIYDTIIPGNL